MTPANAAETDAVIACIGLPATDMMPASHKLVFVQQIQHKLLSCFLVYLITMTGVAQAKTFTERQQHLTPGAGLQLEAVEVIEAAAASIAAKKPQPPPILTTAQAGPHASARRLHAASRTHTHT